jgi:hypothetical protein
MAALLFVASVFMGNDSSRPRLAEKPQKRDGGHALTRLAQHWRAISLRK